MQHESDAGVSLFGDRRNGTQDDDDLKDEGKDGTLPPMYTDLYRRNR